jgi:tRNA 5-methylaminomethyl-2-thiouridine biosynthesis bifunctional protein
MMQAGRPRALPSPGLQWQRGRTPSSAHFGDVYYSLDGGLAQARAVFLEGCDLPAAWQDANSYTIAELGFGTGLNFLAAWQLWRKTRKANARLHYIGVEGYPLTRPEIAQCLDLWPELHALARGLLKVYPHPQPGFHRLFPEPADGSDGGLTLTLLYGEAAVVLSQLEAEVDAWFLDGFAPDRNPDMWNTDVFRAVGRLSKPGAHAASFSVAADVCRGLSDVGFEITKAPGFGTKGEMLRALFPDRKVATPHLLQPWFARPLAAPVQRGHAAIIGGGIAGTSAARALQRRGWRTTIVERREVLADEASGNPAGVMMPRLTVAANSDGRFYAAAWRFALDTLEDINHAGLPLYRDRCGLLQLATDDAETERHRAIAADGPLPEPLLYRVSAKEASDIANCTLPYGALYFPQGGWLKPRELCAALAVDTGIVLNIDIADLRHDNGMWQVIDTFGRICTKADVVILANALGASAFPTTAWLPLKARRGQITMALPSPSTAQLRTVLTYGGYMTPTHQGAHCIGATFDWVDSADLTTKPLVVEDDHMRNLDELERVLPDLMPRADAAVFGGRAGLRCTTLDHLPIVGPVPDQGAYVRDFAELRHGHPWARYPSAAYQLGLYALTGLGARGLVSAPLAGELLASQITGEPWPLERDIVTALHPGRFLVRGLKRRET